MKYKPAVKNELIVNNCLFLEINGMDVSYPLRIAVTYGDMVTMDPYDVDDRVKDLGVGIIFTKEDMERLVTLWNEWKDEPDGQENNLELSDSQDVEREERPGEEVGV